ncbi:hypothetical protein ABIA35_008091 [Catenulispora sp. MAP12-49]|uniref:hypothetical protein n=1 Tax=unclassified Catenulispora TaxID=414885 RepID=UPI0035199001
MSEELLNSLAESGYSSWSIPGPRDGEIASIVEQISTAEDFQRVNSGLNRTSARVLSAFAARTASLSVRNASVGQLRQGIIAILVAAGVEDDRELLIPLSLLFRAAELIGVDALEVVGDLLDSVSSRGLALIREFASRNPSDRAISLMGYREGEDRTGFRFISEW